MSVYMKTPPSDEFDRQAVNDQFVAEILGNYNENTKMLGIPKKVAVKNPEGHWETKPNPTYKRYLAIRNRGKGWDQFTDKQKALLAEHGVRPVTPAEKEREQKAKTNAFVRNVRLQLQLTGKVNFVRHLGTMTHGRKGLTEENSYYSRATAVIHKGMGGWQHMTLRQKATMDRSGISPRAQGDLVRRRIELTDEFVGRLKEAYKPRTGTFDIPTKIDGRRNPDYARLCRLKKGRGWRDLSPDNIQALKKMRITPTPDVDEQVKEDRALRRSVVKNLKECFVTGDFPETAPVNRALAAAKLVVTAGRTWCKYSGRERKELTGMAIRPPSLKDPLTVPGRSIQPLTKREIAKVK